MSLSIENISGSSQILNQAPQNRVASVESRVQAVVAFFSQPFAVLKSSVQAYPAEAHRQFNEMAVPRVLPDETDFELVKKETALSVALTNKLTEVTALEIAQLLGVMDSLDFKDAENSSVLLNPKLPHIALEALRRGLLHPQHGPKQVTTILNFWAALQYHQDRTTLETISVVDLRAKGLIRETLQHPTDDKLEPFLQGEKFDVFMQKMAALPLSEQCFLLVPDIQGDVPQTAPQGNPYNTTVSQAVKATGVNVFNRVLSQNKRIIPSMGMMQAFLEAQYGDNAVDIKSRVYLSTFRHIYETRLNDTCDLMVPTPNSEGRSRCPERADGFQAPWYDFLYHDFFHAILTSAIGKIYRKVGMRASDITRTYANSALAEDREGLNQLAESLTDMDFPTFHHYNRWEQATAFWLAINATLYKQKLLVDHHQELEKRKIAPPFRAEPISVVSELGILKTFVNSFVHQNLDFSLSAKSLQDAIAICQSHPEAYHPLLLLQEVKSEPRATDINSSSLYSTSFTQTDDGFVFDEDSE